MSVSIIIPTFNAEDTLSATLDSLGNAYEILVVDGGSIDGTVEIAKSFGAIVIKGEKGRGVQLATGAAVASGDWLLFLHADTQLETGWHEATQQFVSSPCHVDDVAVFTFSLDSHASQARRLEKIVAWRTHWFGLPYGDQGLLISREHYLKVGGFAPIPLMEDVAMIRKVPRSSITQLPIKAITSAKKWEKQGWIYRSGKNFFCLALYYLGISPQRILQIYG